MIRRVPHYDPSAPIIVIDIGNTTTQVATWHKDELKTPLTVPTADSPAFAEAYTTHADLMPKKRPAAVVVGSVVPEALDRIRSFVEEREDLAPLVVGETIDAPIELGVKDTQAIGTDRVCAAATAYHRIETGCVVVDFGSAVTVDLIDDEGTLVGGAILPGLKMQLRALHEFTAKLPEVEPGIPETPFGRNSVEAMQIGVCWGVAGAVRSLVEAYAAFLNRWPQVVATGGDLEFLAPFCDYLDTTVDHLTLRGVALAYTKHIESHGA